ARIAHLAAMIAAFVIIPTFASIILRETGKPYTYIHDGALMIEEASRKLLAGMNPYVADYLDTPMFYWPMINNPALYHLTYFPFMFLVTVPFVWLFDHVGIFWDQRYLYLPAYVATLCLVPFLIPRRGEPPHPLGVHDGDMRARLALTAIVALNPQLFPFVVEGRNDFFVLLPLFGAVLLLQRRRRRLDLSDLGHGLFRIAPRARRHRVPPGGLPVRRGRDRRRRADRRVVAREAVAPADDRDAAVGLRPRASRVPLLREVLP